MSRPQLRRKTLPGFATALLATASTFAAAITLVAQEPPAKPAAPAVDKEAGTFKDGKRGDVPEGAAEMVTPNVERAVTNGLDWLAKQQAPDGSFGSGTYRGNLAVTSLAGLAFMANGSSPGRGPYGTQIERALGYIMENVQPGGFIAVRGESTHGPMYSHGFATLFLAEAYGMTRRAEIREKLEKAVRLIVDCQNPEGGWRYQPQPRDADTSVTICQINALRAARNAGIFVPKETVEKCIKYVRDCQNPDGGFRYMTQPGASQFPRSAAGIVALQSAGVYDSKEIEEGIKYLKQFTPTARFSQRYSHYFYGHYYAAQAMWIRGGADWNEWYPAIRDELLSRQSGQGFWTDHVCNEYGTAMAAIVLQVPNNFLPIFQR
ncbi:prenyltransferase [bacterium]|nr:prenyltransferase [bacterium]